MKWHEGECRKKTEGIEGNKRKRYSETSKKVEMQNREDEDGKELQVKKTKVVMEAEVKQSKEIKRWGETNESRDGAVLRIKEIGNNSGEQKVVNDVWKI